MHILCTYVAHFYLECAVDTQNYYVGDTPILKPRNNSCDIPYTLRYRVDVQRISFWAIIAWKKSEWTDSFDVQLQDHWYSRFLEATRSKILWFLFIFVFSKIVFIKNMQLINKILNLSSYTMAHYSYWYVRQLIVWWYVFSILLTDMACM